MNATPTRVSFLYMHDNCTFSRLTGSIESILDQARALAVRSPYGMLCSTIVLSGTKELRRVGPNVHAKRELGNTTEWEAAVRADPDIMRLIEPTPRTEEAHAESSYPGMVSLAFARILESELFARWRDLENARRELDDLRAKLDTLTKNQT